MNGPRHLLVAPEKVAAVLLADGWHRVFAGSFVVGSLGLGDDDHRGVLGYRFEEMNEASLHASATLAGPLDSIIAVRQITPRVRQLGDLDRARVARDGGGTDEGARRPVRAGR
jgi:hypothetical protein